MILDSPLQVRSRVRPLAIQWERGWRVLVMISLGWLFALPVLAQHAGTDDKGASAQAGVDGAESAAPARAGAAADYAEQRRRIEAGDGAADFTALRVGFTRTDGYAENIRRALALNQAMFKAMDRDEFERCSELARRALAHDYTNLQSHYGAMVCHFQQGDDKQGQHHQWVMQGLLNSLRASGVGTDPNRPYRPINVDEVDGFLRLMGYEVRNRVAAVKDGQPLEVITVYDNQQEQSQQLFFDSSRYGDGL